MDLTTLLVVGSLFFGLIVGDAALLGNSLYVSIAIPSNLDSSGFSRATAEQIFVAEINRYTRLPSVIPTPSVETSSSPGLPMALAKPLQLDGVVYAVQASIRNYGVVNVTGSLVADRQGTGLKMFIVINNPPDPPLAMSLEQPDGNPKAVIEKAARQTMIAIAPFRVAITDFQGGIAGDPTGFDRSREVIAAGLAQPWDPRAEGATETALLINLLGILEIRDGNLAKAEQEFTKSKRIPGAYKTAHALASLNQAFLAIVRKQPVEAGLRYNEGVATGITDEQPNIMSRLKLLAGLVVWSQGDLAAAERDFRAAIQITDNDEMPHLYLAELLTDRGDTAAAEFEQMAATEVRRFDPKFSSFAAGLFQVDPIHGGYHPIF